LKPSRRTLTTSGLPANERAAPVGALHPGPKGPGFPPQGDDKQTSLAGMAAVVATLALGISAINQVPSLVALNYCGQKTSDSDKHLCKVTGHIAIAVTVLTGSSAVISAVAAYVALFLRSKP
jgi:hypothetical protein